MIFMSNKVKVFYLSAISFLINLSGGMLFGNLILVSNAVGLTRDMLGLSRSIGDAFGYISKVTSAILSDRYKDRRSFLIIGYGLSIVLKPLFILSVCPYFSTPFRVILFFTINIVDKLISSIRDIPRDSMISEIDPENIQQNILIRKVSSYAGTTLGVIMGNILYGFQFTPMIVALIAYVPCVMGIIVAFSNIPESFSHEDKTLNFQEFKNHVKESMYYFIPVILSICIGLLGKINESYFWKEASDKLNITKHNGWLFFCSYFSSALTSYILTKFQVQKPKHWLSLSFVFLIVSNIINYFSMTVMSVFTSTIFMGMFGALIDNLIPIVVLTKIKEKQIKATMVSVVNICISFSMFLSPILINILLKRFTLSFLSGILVFPCVTSIMILQLFA